MTVSLARTAPASLSPETRVGQDQVHPVAGQRKATQAGDLVYRNGDRALALGQDGGEEPPIARLHDGRPGDRNALRQTWRATLPVRNAVPSASATII